MADEEKTRILIVEDNPGDALLVAEMLRTTGSHAFETDRLETLARSVDQLARTRYDLVLVDLSLPDSHGLDTFREIKAAASDTVPVIIMTSLDDENVAVEAVRAGAQDYIVKGQIGADALVRACRYATERKQIEQRLIDANRTRAAGALTRGLMHNVVNMVNGMLLNIEMARADASDDQDLMLEAAQQAGRRVVDVFEMAAMFARLRGVEPVPLDLVQVLNDTVLLFRTTLDSRIEFESRIPEASFRLFADPGELQHALINVAVNASDAVQCVLASGGQARIVVELSVAEETAVITIADNGEGIDDDAARRVFEPFFTTKANDEGIGLGLTSALGIVRSVGGTITFDSARDRGTTFSLTFPKNGGHSRRRSDG